MQAAMLSATWPGAEAPQGIEDQVAWLGETVRSACDISMPRAKPRPQRAAYWWTEEIADLRRTSVQARRRFKRMRRCGLDDNDEGMAEALEHYRTSRNALSAAIRKSKARSWDEQLQDLNADPWGRPYKAVMKKLRR